MPAEQVTMRRINDILRLTWACELSNRQGATNCGVAWSTDHSPPLVTGQH